MPIRAGAFDRRIQILRLDAAAKNGLGEKVPAYSVLFSCWASRNYRGGSEKIAASGEAATESAKFTVRYAAATVGITTADRVRYKNKDFRILSADEFGAGEAIDLYCEGVVG